MNLEAATLFEAAPCRFEPICGGWVLTEQGPVCGVCRKEFGGYLQPLPAPAVVVEAATVQAGGEDESMPTESAPEMAGAGSAATLARLRRLLPNSSPPPPPPAAERRNQRCWLCEERRTCIQVNEKWECRECQAIT